MIAGTALVIAAGIWLLLGFLGIAMPAFSGWASVFGMATAGIALVDAIILMLTPLPRCERETPSIMSLGANTEIRVCVSGISPVIRRVWLFDGIPDQCRAPALPLDIRILRGKRRGDELRACYDLMPVRRGDLRFGRIHLRFPSPLGLWTRSYRAGKAAAVKVFPAFLKDERAGLALMAGKAASDSVHPVRRRGHGTEFLQLRDYRDGDILRLVDWKATSRMRKLIVKELQEEQNQEIIFLLDTGYRMYARDSDISHFDRALEGLLYLSHVALKQGDSVGVMTFGPEERWVSPVKGRSSMNLLLTRLYDLEAQPLPASPAASLERLAARLRRRSLIIIMSNLREEDSGNLDRQLPLLAKNHVVMTLWIRENVIESLVRPPFADLPAALTAATARLYLDERGRMQAIWRKKGIHVLDTSPQQLTANLVNKYWEIKKSGKL